MRVTAGCRDYQGNENSLGRTRWVPGRPNLAGVEAQGWSPEPGPRGQVQDQPGAEGDRRVSGRWPRTLLSFPLQAPSEAQASAGPPLPSLALKTE